MPRSISFYMYINEFGFLYSYLCTKYMILLIFCVYVQILYSNSINLIDNIVSRLDVYKYIMANNIFQLYIIYLNTLHKYTHKCSNHIDKAPLNVYFFCENNNKLTQAKRAGTSI